MANLNRSLPLAHPAGKRRHIDWMAETADKKPTVSGLNISRYVSTAEAEVQIDLAATHEELVEIEKQIQESTLKHNEFLKELGLAPLPGASP